MTELMIVLKGCAVVVVGLCGLGTVVAIAVTIAVRRGD